MDVEEKLFCGFAIFVVIVFIFGMGAVFGMPNELDNGCIVYEDKIYCEEIGG